LSLLAEEFERKRRDRNLSLRAVGAAAGVSASTVWRFVHGRLPRAQIVFVARLLAIVGLDFVARAYPGPTVLRDAASTKVLQAFRGELHELIRVRTEVPFPNPGDQRRWDLTTSGVEWRYGVEIETGPRDAQALAGRLQQKVRDGDVDGVLLILPATPGIRRFLAAAAPLLGPLFPVPGPVALDRLRRGEDPGGSAVIVLRVRGTTAAAVGAWVRPP